MRARLIWPLLAVLLAAPLPACDDEDQIPNWQIVGCYSCHDWRYMPGLIQFGADYSILGHAWSADLAELDSDGDGWSNGIELQDPEGGWRPGYPPPGDPSEVTDPGDPESHPEGTPTDPPTPSPTPSPTAPPTEPAAPTTAPTAEATEPPTGSPTGSPTPPASLELEVFTDRALYYPGDRFRAGLRFVTAGEPRSIRQYLVLDVHGAYFFHPSWGSRIDSVERTLPPGELSEWFLELRWPGGVGSDQGLRFWLAAVDPATGELPGGYRSVEWGYRE